MSIKDLREAVYAAALKVVCPLCKQPPDQPCWARAQSGVRRHLPKPHDRRIHAANVAGHWTITECKR